jgi:hypothetical protein
LSTTRAACTIVSRNYLHFARTLFDSFHALHPNYEFYVLVVDRPSAGCHPAAEPFHVVWVEDLGIRNFSSVAFKYDILELNTNVKPTFLSYLLSKGINELIYFDPDIYMFDGMDFVFDLLSTHPIILTPHSLSPTPVSERFLEQQFLSLGVFNLGFIAVASCAETARFLSWWEERCLSLAFAEARTGLYVDQKWITIASCFFEGILILKHPGCNVAYWNIFERRITRIADHYMVNDRHPLVFYHFSGFNLDNPYVISEKLKSTITVKDRPDLAGLYELYRSTLITNAIALDPAGLYSYSSFNNGVPISGLARRVYAAMLDLGEMSATEDPFDAHGVFYSFARKKRLLSSASQPSVGALSYKDDKRVRYLHAAFRLALRILGEARYTLLLRYLSYISIQRNQTPIISPGEAESK